MLKNCFRGQEDGIVKCVLHKLEDPVLDSQHYMETRTGGLHLRPQCWRVETGGPQDLLASRSS